MVKVKLDEVIGISDFFQTVLLWFRKIGDYSVLFDFIQLLRVNSEMKEEFLENAGARHTGKYTRLHIYTEAEQKKIKSLIVCCYIKIYQVSMCSNSSS